MARSLYLQAVRDLSSWKELAELAAERLDRAFLVDGDEAALRALLGRVKEATEHLRGAALDMHAVAVPVKIDAESPGVVHPPASEEWNTTFSTAGRVA